MREQRTDIQGLRAIAVTLVLLFHAHIPGMDGGYVGVDVFFVISGFLISTHLIERLQRDGRVGFGEFYARRARRLLPASLTVIALTVVAAVIWAPLIQVFDAFKEAIAAALYVPNILFAVKATDYLADTTPSLFLHYWSLGVEEQFYLVWPILLLLLFRVFKSRRRLVTAVVVLSAISYAICVFLTGLSQPWAFFMLPARAWEFGIGTLAAFALLNNRRVLSPRLAAPAGWIGLACIVAAGTVLTSETTYPGYAVAIPVVGTALVIVGGSTRTAAGPTALLSIRPMRFLGDISYSLYLVHWPLLQLPLAARGYMDPLPLWVTALIAVACVPVGWLMYTYVEQPGRRAAWLVGTRPRRTFGVAVAAMAAVIVLAVAGLAWTPGKFDDDKSASAAQIGPDPVGTAFVPDNLTPPLDSASSDYPIVYANGCFQRDLSTDGSGCSVGLDSTAPRVALFGDSHAAQWYPALEKLANEGKIQLDTNSKSACPAASVHQFSSPKCDEWRQAVINRLNDNPPDVILLGSYGAKYTSASDDPGGEWRRATLATLDKLPKRSRVAILADTPSPGINPAVCLSAFLDAADKCALPRDHAILPALRSAELSASRERGVGYFDYTDLFCDAAKCPSIIGNILVYRDNSHITTKFSVALADRLMADIQELRTEPPKS